MNAIISSEILDIEELKAKLAEVPSMDGLELSSQVSTTETYTFGDENAKYRVAVLDLGVKKNILRNFDDRDVYAKGLPGKNTFEEMEKDFSPSVILSPTAPAIHRLCLMLLKQ
jgi:carbamoyl-phosphate synthase small subunit